MARRRSASRSPTSRPRAAGATAGRGARRPAPRCCVARASARRGSRRSSAWRLAAIVSLAMADAAEEVAGLPAGADPAQVAERPRRRRWPRRGDPSRARADSLASSPACSARPTGLGHATTRGASSGIGDQRRLAARRDFPPDLAATMTSPPRGVGRPARSTATRCSTRSSAGSSRASTALRAGSLRRRRRGASASSRTAVPVRLERPDGTAETVERARASTRTAARSCVEVADGDGGERRVLVGRDRPRPPRARGRRAGV